MTGASDPVATTVAGDGIVLRPLEVDDAEAHAAGNDEEVRRAFEFPRLATVAETRAWIERGRAAWAEGGPVRSFGVWREPGGELVGNVEVRDLGDGRVNLSYVVFPAWRRQGVAVAAARAALGYAAEALGARTAVVKALADNHASLAVARRLDAEQIGTEPNDLGSTLVVFHLDLPCPDPRA